MIYQYYFKRLELFKIPYRILLAYHSPLGNTIKLWRSYRMLTSILFIRNDMHILNLTYTIIQLRKAINALFHRIQTRGSFLIYAEEYNALKMKHDSVFVFVNSWLPGLLTNYKRVIISVAVNTFHQATVKPLLSRGQLEAVQASKFTPFPTARVIYDKTLFPRIPKLPSISLSISDNFIWLNECHNLGIPSIQLCDTQSNFDLITYPIVANQKSVPITYLLIHLFSEISNNALMQDHLAFSSYYKYHAQMKIWRTRLKTRRIRKIKNFRKIRAVFFSNITNRATFINSTTNRRTLGKRNYIALSKKVRSSYYQKKQIFKK
jgi:ribosomal protein S2